MGSGGNLLNPALPLLKVTGDADASNSTYNVGLAGGTSLDAGSSLTLLEVDTAAGNTLTATSFQPGSGGAVQIGSTVAHSITADITVDPARGSLKAIVRPGSATEQSKDLSEGFISGLSLVTRARTSRPGRAWLRR